MRWWTSCKVEFFNSLSFVISMNMENSDKCKGKISKSLATERPNQNKIRCGNPDRKPNQYHTSINYTIIQAQADKFHRLSSQKDNGDPIVGQHHMKIPSQIFNNKNIKFHGHISKNTKPKP